MIDPGGRNRLWTLSLTSCGGDEARRPHRADGGGAVGHRAIHPAASRAFGGRPGPPRPAAGTAARPTVPAASQPPDPRSPRRPSCAPDRRPAPRGPGADAADGGPQPPAAGAGRTAARTAAGRSRPPAPRGSRTVAGRPGPWHSADPARRPADPGPARPEDSVRRPAAQRCDLPGNRPDRGRAQHAVPVALDVPRPASHSDARSGRHRKGGGLDSSVRYGYTASLRCPLTSHLRPGPCLRRSPGGPRLRAH